MTLIHHRHSVWYEGHKEPYIPGPPRTGLLSANRRKVRGAQGLGSLGWCPYSPIFGELARHQPVPTLPVILVCQQQCRMCLPTPISAKVSRAQEDLHLWGKGLEQLGGEVTHLGHSAATLAAGCCACGHFVVRHQARGHLGCSCAGTG